MVFKITLQLLGDKLANLSGCDSYVTFKKLHRNLVDDALKRNKILREPSWSQSIAVGEKQFITDVKKRLASKALGRKTEPLDDGFQLREDTNPYLAYFDVQNRDIARKNTYKWEIFTKISDRKSVV